MQSEPPNIAPARKPPLWEGCDAPAGEGVKNELEVVLRASQVQNLLASSGFTIFAMALAATVQTAEISGF